MYLINEMTRPQVEDRIREFPIAILPMGSCEQHGPHLPLGTDSMLALELAKRVSEKCGALIYPPLHFGYSWVWREIAGTATVEMGHLKFILKDIAKSAEFTGIKVLIYLNGHESNNSTIKYAIREYQDHTSVKLLGMFYPGFSEIYDDVMESKTWGGMFHACEFETSLMLAAYPNLVNMDLAVAEYPPRPSLYGMDNTSLGAMSTSGVYGDPIPATAAKGERLFNFFADRVSDLIKSIDI